jgi:hypothetical protein
MKLVHIINPVKVGPTSDLYSAQPVTFETMRRAKSFAELSGIEVELWTTQFEEDREIIPGYFQKTSDLTRSVLDFGTFKKHRKLPLIADILNKAVEVASNSDFIIYTNADIAVLPYFYTFIANQIQRGVDAMVINRRTIQSADAYSSIEEMYADFGKVHPGFDCFIMRSSIARDSDLSKVCIGTTRIGLALIANLIMNSYRFELYSDSHVTFHLGEDKPWTDGSFHDYVEHNERHVIEILKRFSSVDEGKFSSSLVYPYFVTLNASYNKCHNNTQLAESPARKWKFLKRK